MKVRPPELKNDVNAAIEAEKDDELIYCIDCNELAMGKKSGICKACGFNLGKEATGVLIW
jgi:uncharacterized paraquat-inducible protein A